MKTTYTNFYDNLEFVLQNEKYYVFLAIRIIL
jgi:hypothetical protein